MTDNSGKDPFVPTSNVPLEEQIGFYWDQPSHLTDDGFDQGTLTLIQKGEVSVSQTSLYLLVRNWLHQEKIRNVLFIFKTT